MFSRCYPSRADTTLLRLRQFNRQFQTHYGYANRPSEDLLIDLGYRALDKPGRIPEAIQLFQMAIDDYPNSSNAFDSMGDAYAKNGQTEKAIASYKKAIDLHSADFSEESIKKLKKLQKL